jgi:hypothetical protein
MRKEPPVSWMMQEQVSKSMEGSQVYSRKDEGKQSIVQKEKGAILRYAQDYSYFLLYSNYAVSFL